MKVKRQKLKDQKMYFLIPDHVLSSILKKLDLLYHVKKKKRQYKKCVVSYLSYPNTHILASFESFHAYRNYKHDITFQ